MLKIELSPAAQIEFDDAADCYGDQDPILKVRFITKINSTLEFVRRSLYRFRSHTEPASAGPS